MSNGATYTGPVNAKEVELSTLEGRGDEEKIKSYCKSLHEHLIAAGMVQALGEEAVTAQLVRARNTLLERFRKAKVSFAARLEEVLDSPVTLDGEDMTILEAFRTLAGGGMSLMIGPRGFLFEPSSRNRPDKIGPDGKPMKGPDGKTIKEPGVKRAFRAGRFDPYKPRKRKGQVTLEELIGEEE